MAIARHSIEDLKKRSKISDFILSTTTGKLRGSKGMALCPFHGEKTASMSFTDTENLFPVSYTHLTLPTICSV